MEDLGFQQFGLIGSIIGALFYYIVRKDNFISDLLARHEEMYKTFTATVQANTEVTKETSTLIKNLNGKLERAIIEKGTGK